jgi:hypothetical protein
LVGRANGLLLLNLHCSGHAALTVLGAEGDVVAVALALAGELEVLGDDLVACGEGAAAGQGSGISGIREGLVVADAVLLNGARVAGHGRD